ncbi:MAG: YaeQ family protein [Bdellovibrionales bacterium]|nr:YaeQ family protein [Bdellovibrionales bacterium]
MTARQLLTYELDVSDVDRGNYGQTRLQLSTHPEEPPQFTVVTALAFAHHITLHPKLGEGWGSQREPTLYAKDTGGELVLWANVGELHHKLLKPAQRLQHVPNVYFYFYEPGQVEHFCKNMRGSKENWISPYNFYQLPDQFVDELASIGTGRRNRWQISIVHEELLITTASGEFLQTHFAPLDMWREYQESLVIPPPMDAPLSRS